MPSSRNFLKFHLGYINQLYYKRKEQKFIAIEGFVSTFPENFKLGEKLFKWLKS
jgi:hypothetical protein